MMWLLETMKHYLQYEIHHSKYYLQRYFELVLLFQTLQLIAQGLSHQLKSKGWWNFIIFPKTVPPGEGELKPNYSNSNKLMLKMFKNIQDIIHVPSPWIIKGKIGNMWFGGHKGISSETPWSDYEFDTWLGVLNLTSWGPNLSCSIRIHSWYTIIKLSPENLGTYAKSSKIPSLPKEARQLLKVDFPTSYQQYQET